MDVGNDHIDTPRGHLLLDFLRLLHRGGGEDPIALGPQNLYQGLSHPGVILDNEYGGVGRHRFGLSVGTDGPAAPGARRSHGVSSARRQKPVESAMPFGLSAEARRESLAGSGCLERSIGSSAGGPAMTEAMVSWESRRTLIAEGLTPNLADGRSPVLPNGLDSEG